MTTERLYYADAYTLAFDAHIIERIMQADHPAVILDRTYFYPEGGGQPCDTGTLGGVGVIDVQTRESDRAVIHILDTPLAGDTVHGEIDAARRRDLRLHHSGQHILSQALMQAAHAETISVHMSLDSMTIDVNRGLLTAAETRAVEALANRVVQDDLSVRVWFPEAAEVSSLGLRKLPEVSGSLRVVDIGGFDVTACGGTHVARTGEIGLIKIVKAEKRGSGTRVEFKCGLRALDDYTEKSEIITRLAADLSVGYADLPDSVARLRDELRQLRAELKPLRDQALDAEARTLTAGGLDMDGWRVIACAFEGRDSEAIKTLAQKIAAQPNTIALIGLSGDKAQIVIACAEGVTVNAAALLKTALKTLGTERGGGRPNFAQGGEVGADLAQINAALDAAKAQIGVQSSVQGGGR